MAGAMQLWRLGLVNPHVCRGDRRANRRRANILTRAKCREPRANCREALHEGHRRVVSIT
jgi:hypothetical protein